MKYACAIFLLLIAGTLKAQSIYGKVSSAGSPVASANIKVQGDDKVERLSTSDNQGVFTIRGLAPGNYHVYVSHLGFTSADTVIYLKDSLALQINLKTSATQLDSVVVTSKKNRFDSKIDRVSYRVDGISLYQNKSVTDILKNIPRLNVTRSSIEIRGSGPAAVMIDNRMIYLSSKDLLDYLNIYKDDIQSVEVITNPAANYDAQGSALVNIVTKKRKTPGLFGYIESAATKNSYWEADQSLGLSFRNRNFSLSGSYGNSVGAYRETLYNQSNFIDDHLTDYRDEASNKNHINSNRLTVITELLLSKRSRVFASYNLVTNRGKTDQDHIIRYQNYGSTDSTGLTKGGSNNHGDTHLLNAGYNTQFGKNNTLDVTVDYVNRSNDQNSLTTTSNYFSDLSTETGNRYDLISTGHLPKNVTSTKFDFRLPAAFLKYNVEAGGKWTLFNNNSRTYYDQLINGGTIFTGINTRDTFNYREQNIAAYISADRAYAKFTVKLGLRYEQTLTRGTSGNDVFRNNFGNLFPSVYFQYKLPNASSATISYSRRIIRPSLFDVNPFRLYSSIFSYYVGNPRLIPSLQDNLNLSYNLKGQLLFSAFYNVIHDPVITVPTNMGNVIENAKQNNGLQKNYGFNFDGSVDLIKNLQSNFSFGISSYQLRTDLAYYFNNKPVNINLSTTQSFQINKNLSADLNFSATLPGGGYYISKRKGYSSLDIGLTQSLIKNRLLITLAGQDILKTNSQGSTTSTPQFINTNRNYYDFRQLMLTVRYKFGKEISVVKKRPVNQDINRVR
ncbi:TonB-dependent receptor [Mucilaginibacter achroorhodeus]|uniref:TonB-dependent receptor n=1 Tax=Mucilaginibacter achroorhodeus TaxID=2599294 RepID=A0A563U630_9SPHI|nr:TonB-dependent receptor [Mucilaginibacter achroorhodeus]TWR26810.1 TonB-dependent receptor [Mucilaginibacter achroorhodeus]